MGNQLHSPLWYRVAELRPALRQHVRLHRHVYRKRVWYVLHDPANGRSHRFPAATQRIIGLMNGTHTVQKIWETAGETLGDQTPTQDEMIQLLGQLHAADLLRADVTPDIRELFARFERRQRGQRKQRLGNPLALRFPLWDPDAFLNRTAHQAQVLLGRSALLTWVLVVASGASIAMTHWSELVENFSDQAFTPLNLLLVWLAFPVIKGLHELGHAYATKLCGGEVHEIGVMVLVFVPVPYVDASGASAFPEKRHRMLVGAAGIAVELFIAGLAMILWLAVEPGAVRALAYQVALIGGVSTVLFNGNPLLRFDGYYVLADFLEIPNFSRRANQYIAQLFRRYVLGLASTAPVADATEKLWLAGYALASFVYRVLITVAIVFYLAAKIPVVGVGLALILAATRVISPLTRGLRRLGHDPAVRRQRSRLLIIGATASAAAILVLFVVPMPLNTRTVGVTWPPPQAEVRAGANATVVRLLAPPGTHVQTGDPLIETSDPTLPVRVEVLAAKLREIEARHQAALADSPAKAAGVATELAAATAELRLASQRAGELVIRSPAAGIFVVPDPDDLPGRYVRHGDRIAYITGTAGGTVIAVVDQADIGLIRERTRGVAVRLADTPGTTYSASVRYEMPAGISRLPSPVLGSRGGGPVAVDPADAEGTRTLDRVFQVELGLPVATARLGGRAYVRFDHGTEPLGAQWYRRLRQLLLSRFNA